MCALSSSVTKNSRPKAAEMVGHLRLWIGLSQLCPNAKLPPKNWRLAVLALSKLHAGQLWTVSAEKDDEEEAGFWATRLAIGLSKFREAVLCKSKMARIKLEACS